MASKKPIRVLSQHAQTDDDEDIMIEILLNDGRWLILGMTYDDFDDLHMTVSRLKHELAQRN